MNDGIKILLADDDVEDRFIMEEAFNELGLPQVVGFVENGEKVITFLDDISDSKSLPSLIVLDLNMPLLNGTETLRILKNNDRYSDIPVMIFSTSVNEIEKEQCLSLGATSYITKPVKYEECISIARHFYNFSQDPLSVAEVQKS
jgi:CheY-like chemotaxis protein